MDPLPLSTLSKGSTTILESPSATDLTLLPSQHERKNSKTIKRRHSFHASPSPSTSIIDLPPMNSPLVLQLDLDLNYGDEVVENVSTVVENIKLESNSKDADEAQAVKEDFIGSNSTLERDYFSLAEGGSTGNTTFLPGTINYDERRLGKCKFFSAQKGFGFIVDNRNEDIEGSEVFVHYSAIDSSCNAGRGFRSLAEGEEVEYNLMHGNKGWQAHAVSGPNGTPVIGSPSIPGLMTTRGLNSHDQDGMKQKFGNRHMNYSNYPTNGGTTSNSYNQEAENFSNGPTDSAYFGSPNESGNPSNVSVTQKAPTSPTFAIPTRNGIPQSSSQYQQQQQGPTQVTEYPYQQYHSDLSPPHSVSPPLLPFPPPLQQVTNEGTVEVSSGPIEYSFYPIQNQNGQTRSSQAHSPQRVQAPYPHPQPGHYISQTSPQTSPSSTTLHQSNHQSYSSQQQSQISQSMNFQQPQQFYQSNSTSRSYKNSYSSGNNNNNNNNNNNGHSRRPSSFYNNQHNNNNPPPPHQIQYYSNYSNQYLLHQSQLQYHQQQQAHQQQQQQYYNGYYSNSPPLNGYSNINTNTNMNGGQGFELSNLMSGLELENISSSSDTRIVGETGELVILEG